MKPLHRNLLIIGALAGLAAVVGIGYHLYQESRKEKQKTLEESKKETTKAEVCQEARELTKAQSKEQLASVSISPKGLSNEETVSLSSQLQKSVEESKQSVCTVPSAAQPSVSLVPGLGGKKIEERPTETPVKFEEKPSERSKPPVEAPVEKELFQRKESNVETKPVEETKGQSSICLAPAAAQPSVSLALEAKPVELKKPKVEKRPIEQTKPVEKKKKPAAPTPTPKPEEPASETIVSMRTAPPKVEEKPATTESTEKMMTASGTTIEINAKKKGKGRKKKNRNKKARKVSKSSGGSSGSSGSENSKRKTTAQLKDDEPTGGVTTAQNLLSQKETTGVTTAKNTSSQKETTGVKAAEGVQDEAESGVATVQKETTGMKMGELVAEEPEKSVATAQLMSSGEEQGCKTAEYTSDGETDGMRTTNEISDGGPTQNVKTAVGIE